MLHNGSSRHYINVYYASTYSQLLLEGFDLGLECVHLLRLSLVGGIACIYQLGQTIQSLL